MPSKVQEPSSPPWNPKVSKDKEITPWHQGVSPLESTSTYAAHYQNWGATRMPACRPKDERMMSTAPFKARSTAQDSYIPWGDARRESCKPAQRPMTESSKFDPSTTHRDVRRSLLCLQPVCPCCGRARCSMSASPRHPVARPRPLQSKSSVVLLPTW